MKKIGIIIFLLFIPYFFLDFFFTGSRLGRRLFKYHHKYWNAEKNINYTTEPIKIDGLLNEKDWHLEQDTFVLADGKKKTTRIPEYQFLRDSTLLYFGCSFKIPSDRSIKNISNKDLFFRINMEPKFGDAQKRFRLRFEPVDEFGNPNGQAWCDCGSCRLVKRYQFASHLENDEWSFEFAIPFSEIMSDYDSYLFYRFAFLNKLISPQEFSYYPYDWDRYKYYFQIRPPLYAKDPSRDNDIFRLIRLGHHRRVRSFLAKEKLHNIKSDHKNKEGFTPFIFAILENQRELVNMFLEFGTDINQKVHGKTPLMYAIESGFDDIAMDLIKNGSSLYMADEKGIPPVDYAKKYDRKVILEYIESKIKKEL